MAIHVGTAGFSYNDWRRRFYPESIKPYDMLPFYAHRFSTVEMRRTTACCLHRRSVPWPFRTPASFKFTVRLPGSITHSGDDNASFADLTAWRESLEPLLERHKLGCGVAQFPTSFRPNTSTRAYLKTLRKHIDIPIVVEFSASRMANSRNVGVASGIGLRHTWT
jgi:uncharacterized protein YecE (DUF72 family)